MFKLFSWYQRGKLLAVPLALRKFAKRSRLLGERVAVAVRPSLRVTQDRVEFVGKSAVAGLTLRLHDLSGKPVEVGLRAFRYSANNSFDGIGIHAVTAFLARARSPDSPVSALAST